MREGYLSVTRLNEEESRPHICSLLIESLHGTSIASSVEQRHPIDIPKAIREKLGNLQEREEKEMKGRIQKNEWNMRGERRESEEEVQF